MAERGLNESDAASYYLGAIVLFAASRFVCTALMRYIAPHALLGALATLAALLAGVVVLVGGLPRVIALVAISGCTSLMFRTIYRLAIRRLGDDTKIAASGLIMAILGGALLTALMGRVSDAWGIHVPTSFPLAASWSSLITEAKDTGSSLPHDLAAEPMLDAPLLSWRYG